MSGNFKVIIILIISICVIHSTADYIQANYWGIIELTYNENFRNFDNVIKYIQRQADELQPHLIILLYYTMEDLQHTAEPLYAIPLYNEVLKYFHKDLPYDLKERIYKIRQRLIWDSIVPHSTILLEAAVKPNAGNVIQLLDESENSIAEMSLSLLWNNIIAKFPNPVEKIAKTSSEVKHNVYLLLTLYKMHMIQYRHNDNLIKELKRLQQDHKYNSTVLRERQLIVNEIIQTDTKPRTIETKHVKYVRYIYNRDFQNYNKVIKYIEKQEGLRNKAKLLIALYDFMNDLQHIDDPLKATLLYEEVLKQLNSQTPDDLKMRLNEIREVLSWQTMSPEYSISLEPNAGSCQTGVNDFLSYFHTNMTSSYITFIKNYIFGYCDTQKY